MILYESDNARIEWMESERIIFKKFSGFIKADELREAFNVGYDQLKKAGGKKWMSDNRDLTVYKRDDIDWINGDWFPRMKRAGWKYWALVEPQSPIGAMTMKNFKYFTDEGIVVKIFSDAEDALKWLSTVN